VTLDAKEVAKGYRAAALKLKPVVNDKGEAIGVIDDFIFSRNDCNIFAVLAVGDFIGSSGHLVLTRCQGSRVSNSLDLRFSLARLEADRLYAMA
jgi:hypothetical protein